MERYYAIINEMKKRRKMRYGEIRKGERYEKEGNNNIITYF